MNYFPNGEEEKELVKFVAQYQYIKIRDVKYFFKATKYYKERIRNLVSKKILRRTKWNFVLGDVGIEYVEIMKFEYNKLNLNQKYKERLIRLSEIGALYHNCATVKFTPSFSIKNREVLTTTGRRYIGILNISGIEYLTYQITKNHDKKYITSIIYDMQKEHHYDNFIIFVDDIKRINLREFCFRTLSCINCRRYNSK